MTRKVLGDAACAAKRTPVEVVLGLAIASILSAANADLIEAELLAKLLMASSLLWCVTFATSALAALKVFDQKTRWILTTVFASVAAGYGSLFLVATLETEWWRYAFLLVAAVTAVMLVPVAARMRDTTPSERFWRFNMMLGFRFGIAGLYSGLLYGGLALGLVAVSELFAIRVDGEVFGHMASFVIAGGGLLLAAGGLSDVVRIDRPFDEASLKWVGRLGTFLFIPLLLLYLAILYAYFIKMFAVSDVPSNLISPIALGAGMLGYLGMFVLQPFMQRDDFRPLAWVLKAFPAAFVPIVPLGMWAVWERIGQYGWTEFRYARLAALVCLGVFSLIGAWRWLRGRSFSLTTGPAILAVVSLLAAVGPWSASAVSERSQLARLHEAAVRANALDAQGRLLAAEELARIDADSGATIRGAIEYLVDAHGADAIAHLTPPDAKLETNEPGWRVAVQLGLSGHADARGAEGRYASVYTAPEDGFGISRTGTLREVSVSRESDFDQGDVRVKLLETSVEIRNGARTAQVDYTELVKQIPTGGNPSEVPQEMRRTFIVASDGTIVGEMFLRDASFEKQGATWRLTSLSGFVLLY